MLVIKKNRLPVTAFCLGEGSDLEKDMVHAGKIVAHNNGTYEVFSKEAVNGAGEVARTGDFVKIDVDGEPYPVSRAFFLEHHEESGGAYYQIPVPMKAWRLGQPIFEEIQFLLGSGRLKIDEESEEDFFSAKLWGTVLSANRRATVIIYGSKRDQNGHLTDIDFNFVDESVFLQTYNIIG